MDNQILLEELKKLLKWKKSAAYYAERLNITEDEVAKLMFILKRQPADTEELTEDCLTNLEAEAVRIISETVQEGGDKQVRFASNKPLTKEEIEQHYGVNGVTSRLSTYWNKETPSGKYIVSANIKCLTEDLTLDELKGKLQELFPKELESSLIPEVALTDENMLVILLSDDHCGMINTTNLYKTEDYTQEVYEKRLLDVLSVVKSLGKTYEEIRVISIGDQLQGWNKETTRGGHEVNAVSNKEQFDFYVNARKKFYDALFSSALAVSYTVHEMENSNHSGLGFSYMANQYLSMYLEARWPQVAHISHDSAIDGFDYGVHTIVFTHGKDEKFHKRGMPYNITDKVDLYMFEWLSTMGYNPAHSNITLYKGDLHNYGIQLAKFGRYINIPSIAGNSDYGDLNFGNTKAGAVVEIFNKNTNLIQTIPIWM